MSASLFTVLATILFLAGGLFVAPASESVGEAVGFASLSSVEGSNVGPVTHHSHPTMMSLQGTVEGTSTGDLGVKVSEENDCNSSVFFDHVYTGVIQDSQFNLLLGSQYDLNLNYNQDYYLCLYVEGELVDGPQLFRGGQGQIDIEDVNTAGFATEFVPYAGADYNVDLGNHGLTTIGTGEFGVSKVSDGTNYVLTEVAGGSDLKITSSYGTPDKVIGYIGSTTYESILLGMDAGGDYYGAGNVFIGQEAGMNNAYTSGQQGNYDVYIGFRSGKGITTGTDNFGMYNVGVGGYTLYYNTTGYNNMAIGYYAMRNNTTGPNNVALGVNALTDNVGGGSNMAIGFNSQSAGTEGGWNVSVGNYTLNYNEEGSYNVAIGDRAGYSASGNSFTGNVLIGKSAGNTLTTGSYNNFIGYYAGARQTTNSNLLIIDNQLRASTGVEATNAIIYGTMASLPENQALTLNADTTISQDLNVTGNVGIGGNAFADAFIDFTPAFTGTPQEALNQIYQVSSKTTAEGKTGLDHSTLPQFALAQIPQYEYKKTGTECHTECAAFSESECLEFDNDTGQCTIPKEQECLEEKEVCNDKFDYVIVGYKDGRDLGAMTTLLTESVKALKEENDLLKTELCKKDPAYSWCK